MKNDMLKMTVSFNSRVVNFRRNMITIFHATSIVKHVEIMVAKMILNYSIYFGASSYFKISDVRIVAYRFFFYLDTKGAFLRDRRGLFCLIKPYCSMLMSFPQPSKGNTYTSIT